MSLNWREIEKILSELELAGCRFGRMTQPTFSSVVFELYAPDRAMWRLFIEIGNQDARIHRLSSDARPKEDEKVRKMGKKLRFVQFFHAQLEGAIITAVKQQEGDRLVRISFRAGWGNGFLFIRLYSGAGANIIVTGEDLIIKDVLLRRPQRGEIPGKLFESPDFSIPSTSEAERFSVRDYPSSQDFNSFIEESHAGDAIQQDALDILRSRLEDQRDAALADIESSIRAMERRKAENEQHESLKHTADLLASHIYLIGKGAQWVTIKDWSREDGHEMTIALDPLASPSDNAQAYYDKYRRTKGAAEHAERELEQLERRRNETLDYYTDLLRVREEDRRDTKVRLSRALKKEPAKTPKEIETGIIRTSGGFTLIAGRNARENDALLRTAVKGNDWWMHTRDVPGGYVFIKNIQGKTIPLPVLLDAAQLSVYFSKVRTATHADVYYTQVKYLKRVKGGKLGLVIPTQEKTIHVKVDVSRVKELLQGGEADDIP
ncbi:NFACT RNA binding domain-containing protein [Parasphaerochaeta coccoides]|uniref:NFACT RNA-binding domain-containing protein n=1 Tax=Parasphaerochaeta coccoides (strain ATCC BAA-1237 / DSM 17374 / SPN1) TaxID=760011 RepID=F4GI12_PARC1|nr:NFACT family protein [Parasphaerochaeta coccoides]AEC02125.1 protein of unknown function DUF814 [Parasphaerochaeta coccoides DSM 17374]